MNQELFETFKGILVDDFSVPADDIAPDVTFEALGLDSLDVVELTLVIEERTGVKLEDEELEDIKTVADAIEKVEAKQQVSA